MKNSAGPATGSADAVERDEYGLETSAQSRPPSTQPASKSPRQLTTVGPTLSKILPTTPRQAARSSSSDLPHSLQALHDLVLDRHHSELHTFIHLSQLHFHHPRLFSAFINGYLNGYTPFHQACDIGDLKKVQILCAAGVDRELKDETDGLTGIELAQEAGRTEVVDFLSSLPSTS